MDKLQKYILKNFLNIFINIFLILFLITSIIIIISISNVTSSIHITFLELLKMYFLSLTKILIVTLSISFFISAVQTYSNLSDTQELIAIFSTGIKPKKILFPMFVIAIILTFINFFILFVSIPYSDLVYHNFKIEKKQESQFNIETSQISQQFGKWNAFIEKKDKNIYKKVYLYNPYEKKFITAQNAKTIKYNNYLIFQLNNGYIYQLDKNLTVKFNVMNINQYISYKSFSILEYTKYLKENKKLFLFYLPFALISVILFFYIPLFSFFHPRLHKNHSLIYSVSLLTIYLIFTKLAKSFCAEFIIMITFFIFGLILYLKDKKF
ncbi:lipopolysaccharide export system permease protein [Lebetimonas natsushimae]|uniref:Lipopolysaccharide export system permease protein n=1 Tax=Lebetimonas natsushimae TaxID=1936991 RepID=A0A292YD38_9BACT|nr:LptF/LptG family permease [Lebetimonas natsushimae]GAX87366.1 lipopolysaccharide export system permease protein [Lebetimonas natsushimae]